MTRMTHFLFAIFISFLTINSYALTFDKHIVIAPKCLLNNITDQHTLAQTANFSMLEVSDAGVEQLIAEKNKHHKPTCGGFTDVTQDWQKMSLKSQFTNQQMLMKHLHSLSAGSHIKKTYDIRYATQVGQVIKQLVPNDMWSDLTTLSGFHDRYAKSDNGVKAMEWIKQRITQLAEENHFTDYTISNVTTPYYQQPSLIIKIGQGNEPGVVIGAHMDTTSGAYTNKPGADDDGTGSVTVIEVARGLFSSALTFKKPIYLMWYAAEEEGLLGSRAVVASFKKQNIAIDAVMHFDMTGYAYRKDPTLWLMRDYVNKDLNLFLEKLITTYVKKPFKYTACGYACSDHATWTQNGFAASIAAEAAFENTNPSMHSSQDTMEKLSLDHMTDYAKLALAFAVELAEPII